MKPVSAILRHKGKILLVAAVGMLVIVALGMGFNPFYRRQPLDNSSPLVVLTSDGRPLLRSTVADLPYTD